MLWTASLFVAVAAAALALALLSGSWPLVVTHAFFALAAAPLMLRAILHFVPVLTRSAGPGRMAAAAPSMAAFGGLLVLAAFAGWVPRHVLLVAALAVALAAFAVGAWTVGRLRRTLGSPHPGARWYVAAPGFLLLGLGCVFGIVLDVEHYPFWRQLHLHANLFGWVALTALGTLPVLLPTALQRPDPGAAARLRRDLPIGVGGALALASGAALGWPLVSAAGAAALAVVVGRDLAAWRKVFGVTALLRGAAGSLGLATVFLLVLLATGVAHGFHLLPASGLLPAFVFGFLLPLVTGALTQLLPVWRFPGPRTPQRERFASALARHAPWRGLVFVLAGSLQLFGGRLVDWGVGFAAAGLLAFLAAIAHGWRPRD